MNDTKTSLDQSQKSSFTNNPLNTNQTSTCSSSLDDNNILDCWLDKANNGDPLTITVISLFLPLSLGAIYSLYSQVRSDHVAPIFIINLLLSDMIQISYMIIKVAGVKFDDEWDFYFEFCYFSGLVASCFFMIFIALERYLVIAWPLWYRFKRTIKASVFMCVATWIVCFFFPFINGTNIGGFVLLPLPFLVFFLVGTLRALSAAQSVPTDEKRRIVATLVVVLLIYVTMFLPRFFYELFFSSVFTDNFAQTNPNLSNLFNVACYLIQLNPLTDLFLYIFIKKWAVDKLLAFLCCCKMKSDRNQMTNISITTTPSSSATQSREGEENPEV